MNDTQLAANREAFTGALMDLLLAAGMTRPTANALAQDRYDMWTAEGVLRDTDEVRREAREGLTFVPLGHEPSVDAAYKAGREYGEAKLRAAKQLARNGGGESDGE